MPWVIVDLAVALTAVVALLLTGLSLWRAVKGLGAEVGRASSQVGAATYRLAAQQAGPAARAVTSTAPPAPGRRGSPRR